MKLRGIFLLALLLGVSPALAQVNPGTTPLSIPKGGTGNASGIIPAPQVSFTQNGTGAVSVSVDALLRGKVFVPEMYASAAISAPLGTAAASVPDATAAIQATVNALCAIPGGGTVQLGPGAYGITSVIVNCNNVWIRGSGLNATTLVQKLSTPSSALVFSAGASELSNTGVMDLAIGSNDTVITKIAINISDVSFFTIKNVNIAHYPVDGTLYRASGGFGNAIFVQGREHGVVQDVQAYAEQPLHIATNPNSTISMDSWTFRNLVLVSNLPSLPGPYHVITIDSGVNIYNTTFDGHQNWIGGTDGLHWVDSTSTQPSLGLYISGVKSEQSETGGVSGATINIQHNNGLDGLRISGITGGDRELLKLRKINAGTVSSVYFDPGTGTGTNTVAYDIDGTVNSLVITKALWTNVGGRATTNVVAGQNVQWQGTTPVGFSATVPSDVEYTTNTPNLTVTNLSVVNTPINRLLLGQAGSPVTALGAGTTTTVLHGNATAGAAPTFGAVNLSADAAGTLQAAQEPAHTGDTANSAGSLVLATTKINGVDQTTAWSTYACALASEAGGAIGTGNTLVCTSKTNGGKSVCVTGTITMGAAGIGTATQVSVSLPSTAVRDAMLSMRNRTAGLGGVGDVGAVGLGKALLNLSSSAVGVANSQVTVFSGCYEST